MLSDLFFRVRSLFWRKAVEAEMDDELRFHFEKHVEKSAKAGMTREEALRRARQEFGGMEQVREEVREARGVHFLETFFQDVRYGLRVLRKSPGFTSVAVLTLALGMGANTAIFSVVYSVVLRPLPFREDSRLVVINETTPKVGKVSESYPNFLDWRARSRSFTEMAALAQVSYNLGGVSDPESISGDAVSPNFLSMMGVRPILGRDFEASEEKPGAPRVVLLSYKLWQTHLGGDRNVVGRTIMLDGLEFSIVGVLPADYRSLDTTDVMEPIGVWATANSDSTERGSRGDMTVIGRLAPGVSLGAARNEMAGIAAQLEKEYPGENDQFGIAVGLLRDAYFGEVRPAVLIIFGAVMFVLLIACVNVANLFLVRGASRAKEIGVRIAFGASRGRVIRQMLTESLLLAMLGGALGILIGWWGISGLSRLMPSGQFMSMDIHLDRGVFIFVGLLVVLVAFAFGLVPALHATKPDVQETLKESGRSSTTTAKQHRVRGMLAIAEISLALILLVGAGLMMKSLYRLLSVNPGVQMDRVLTMELDLRAQQYSKVPAVTAFWRQLLDRVRALPGVESAAVGTVVPLTGNHSRRDIYIEGMAIPKPGSFPHPDFHTVSPSFIETLGIPVLLGRTFNESDTPDTPRVGLVNEKLAREFFPNENPIGKRFMFGQPSTKREPKWFTIIGVVGDLKLYGLANPARLEVYQDSQQGASDDLFLVVKARNDAAALMPAIRVAVASIDKDEPISSIATMKELLDASVSTRRITLILLGLFSALALVLAAIGIYGVMAYAVALRTHEIGIRLALGAQRGDVLRMVVGQGARLALIGVAIGIVASFGLTRLLRTMLFEVSANDPITFAMVSVLLTVVALVACAIPARRAMRVDPMVALRYE